LWGTLPTTLASVAASSKRVTRFLTVALIALTWIFVVLLTVPRAISRGVADYGFFTGMAERLRAGDTLYIEVWDNKDPLVFYTLAIARNLGPNGVIGAWILEISWVLMAAIALYVIARFQSVQRPLAAYLGFGLGPLVILGIAYFMGSTHLPAIALILAGVALIYSRHPLTAGIALGVVPVIKLVMTPMAVVLAVVVLFGLRRRSDIRWIALGFASVLVAMSVILMLRGELTGFIETQIHNVLYSQSPIVTAEQAGIVEKIKQHIVILVNPNVAAVEFTITVILAVTAPWWRRSQAANSFTAPLWWLTAAGFGIAIGTIAVTGKWFHHAQAFYVPAALALVLLGAWLVQATKWRSVLVGAICAVATYPLAGLPQPGIYVDAVRDLPDRWAQATSTDTLTSILRDLEPASISFIGETVPQSPGLEEWTIACRHIAQRPFNPEQIFTETLECLPSSEVIVAPQNLESTSTFPAFDEFRAGVRSILDEGFRCEEVSTFLICDSR